MIEIKAGQSFELPYPKRIEGRYFVKLDVEQVWDANKSIHSGITTICCLGHPLHGRKRIRLNGIHLDDFNKLLAP